LPAFFRAPTPSVATKIQPASKILSRVREEASPKNSTQQFHRRNLQIRPTKNTFPIKFSTVVLKSLWKSRRSRTKQPKKPIVYAFCTTTGQMRPFPVKHLEERRIQRRAKELWAV
jgi:hypothetical protein